MFVQLNRANNYGRQSLVYTHGDITTTFGEHGGTVRVQYPDGSEQTHTMTIRVERQTVSESGLLSVADSEIPGITTRVHGIPIWLPLDTKGLLVWIAGG